MQATLQTLVPGRRVILLGYMGSGKTTIGKALSNVTGLPFYDLDWYIESRYRRTIAQIFEERGEDGFREIERNMLHEVAEFEDVIISCGGGTPCFYNNMSYLNKQGQTLYLKASPEVLHKHLKMGRTVRPLLTGKNEDELLEYISAQLAEREPYYLQAHHILDVNLMDNTEKIAESVEKVRELLSL